MSAKNNSTTSTAESPIPILVNNRVVCYMRGTVLDVRREASGLLQKPPALALACDAIQQAQRLGCTEILLTIARGPKYHVTFDTFLAESFPVQRGGYEPQRAIVLTAMQPEQKPLRDKRSLKALDRMRKPKTPQQPRFRGWG